MPRRASTSKPVAPESAEVSRRVWEGWRHARAQKKAWEDREKKLRTQLEKEIGEAPVATIGGVPVISWKVTEKRNVFDQAAHAENEPECHAAYTSKRDGTRPFNELEFDPDDLPDEDEG